MDRAFWRLHDHLAAFAVLGLPTLLSILAVAGATIGILRTWELEFWTGWLLFGLAVPVITLAIVTLGPLPCGVFAWFQANGEPRSPGECFAWCASRLGRLTVVALRLLFSYLLWFLLLGLPMLVFWARTCLAPYVALFETQPRIFQRSRRLVREDHAIHALAGLHLLLTVVLGALIPLPRLLLGSKLFQTEWSRTIIDGIWVVEVVCAVLLTCGVAVSWCVSLALFYHDLRSHREAEGLQRKVRRLDEKYLAQPVGGAPVRE